MNAQTLLIAAAAAFIGYKILSPKRSKSTSAPGLDPGTVVDEPPLLGGPVPFPPDGTPGGTQAAVNIVNRPLLWTPGNEAATYTAAQGIYDSLPASQKTVNPDNVIELAMSTAAQVWPSYSWPTSSASFNEVPITSEFGWSSTKPAWLFENPEHVRDLLENIWARVLGVASSVYGFQV